MKLDVYDMHNRPGVDRIDVAYLKHSDATVITVNCDVLTLGIAATVLQEKYEQYLSTLDSNTALRVRVAVMEACKNETNRG